MEKIHFYFVGETKSETQLLLHLFSLFPIETQCTILDHFNQLSIETSRTTGPIIILLDLQALGNDFIQSHLLAALNENYFNKYPIVLFIKDEQKVYLTNLVNKLENIIIITRPTSKLMLANTFEDIIKKYYKTIPFHQIHNYQNEQFTTISIDILLNLNKAPCDIYLHLGQQDKCIKVIKANENNLQDIIEKYDHKGIHEFFILESDFQKYAEELYSKQIYDSITQSDEKSTIVEKQELLHQKVHQLGISQDLLNNTTKIISQITNNIKNKSLRNLLHVHQSKKFPFIYDHSYLTSIFAIIIAEQTDWASPKITENLAFASLVHDLAFTDSALALVEHRQNLNSSSSSILTKDQLHELTHHPYIMANLLEKDPLIPSDVIKIVRHHHVGFSDNASAYPLKVPIGDLTGPSCAFIIAHEFTLGLYRIGLNLDKIERLFAQLKDTYVQRPFPSLIDFLKKGIHY